MEILYKSIIPKLIKWIGSDTPINIEKYFTQNNPFNHLNYLSEEVYLIEKKLTQDNVIKNSIIYINRNISDFELKFLTKSFIPLVQTKKLKVLNANTEQELVIYLEIILYLQYIEDIKTLIIKGESDKLGTSFRTSSLKKIIDTKINCLQNRLDDPLIPISNKNEITRTKQIISMLKKSQENNYSNIFEYIHLLTTYTSLTAKILDLSDEEITTIKYAQAFHNGKKNSKIELIQSSFIYLNTLFYNEENNQNKYIDSIFNITLQFFDDDIKSINQKKNILTFNKEHIKKPFILKTISSNVPIFIYSNKESPFDEIIEIGFNSLAGLKNKFEPDNPSEDEVSNYKIVKNIVSTLKNDLNFNKKDIAVLKYFFTLLEKGKIPSPHFV